MIKRWDLFIPWIIACLATIGSLFFSELNHTPPCPLCWYQRIFMYPLAIILGIAAFRGAYRIIMYVLPLTLLGLLVATYHVFLMRFFVGEMFCAECVIKPLSPTPITFAFLSFISFLLMNIFLIIAAIRHKRSKKL